MALSNACRQEWMALLALTDEDRLQAAWDELDSCPESRPAYTVLRGPETGLVMVRARAGNTGIRFNLGEMSVTRCSVRLLERHKGDQSDALSIVGHSWIAGCAPGQARLAAIFDALFQTPEYSQKLRHSLLASLRSARQEHLARRRAEVEPTRVDFFTLVRGEE